jgi:hypothetical protein
MTPIRIFQDIIAASSGLAVGLIELTAVVGALFVAFGYFRDAAKNDDAKPVAPIEIGSVKNSHRQG